MMREITLSLMRRDHLTTDFLESILKPFEVQHNAKVHSSFLDWNSARETLMRYGINHNGPDVSEIGSTLMGNLQAFRAIRSFSPPEIDALGSEAAFLPATWQGTHYYGDRHIWSIPWLCESVVFHYRQDILNELGIDPQAAFASLQSLDETIGKIKETGILLPIGLPLPNRDYLMLQTVATWIWGYGGDFISEDGRVLLIDQPEAMEGIEAFFRLYRHCTREGLEQLNQQGVIPLFYNGKVATAVTSMLIKPGYLEQTPFFEPDWKAVRLPALPLVGGSHLIISSNTRQEALALELVKHLSSDAVSDLFGKEFGILPARLKPLSDRLASSNPVTRVAAESVYAGRAFPAYALWGLIEEHLSTCLMMICEQVYRQPQSDLHEYIRLVMTSTVNQINQVLASR